MIEQSILLHVQQSIYYTSSCGQSICNLNLILYPIILANQDKIWRISALIEILENEFNQNITEDILNTAGEMFIYLNHCRDGGNAKWIQFYKDLFKIHEPDVILLTLNRLMKLETTQRDIAMKLLDYLEIQWDLKFRNITSLQNRHHFHVENNLR